MSVYVEPGVRAELAEAVQRYLDAGGAFGGAGAGASAGTSAGSSMDSSGDGWPGPAAGQGGLPPRAPAAGAAAAPGTAAAAAAVDLGRRLLTWEEPCGCPPAVPCSVGHQLDLVITLGGDGTVLWTCGLFAAGAVPPLVPFAMGSLGFMTPFQIGRMADVLGRVTGVERGVPLMLRHRLQASARQRPRCRIIRGDASTADLLAAGGGVEAASCQDEFVVLNEVVIDRGMKAQLCNLQ
ncbi:hypothetical protein CHLNCDRAFT_143392, partial [Chlorella variabilis]